MTGCHIITATCITQAYSIIYNSDSQSNQCLSKAEHSLYHEQSYAANKYSKLELISSSCVVKYVQKCVVRIQHALIFCTLVHILVTLYPIHTVINVCLSFNINLHDQSRKKVH